MDKNKTSKKQKMFFARSTIAVLSTQHATLYRLRRLTEASDTPPSSMASSVASSSRRCALPEARGISKLPRSRRLYQITRPSRSHHNALIRSRRLLRNKNRWPSSTFPWNTDSTRPHSPSKLLRRSTAAVHRETRVYAGRLKVRHPPG